MLANVALTDTFDTWRTRTNQLIMQSEENNILAASAFDTCNDAFQQSATLAAQLLYSNAVVRVALFNQSNTVTAGIAANSVNVIFNTSNTQNIIGQTANVIAANALSNINVLGVVSANSPLTPLLGQFWYDTTSTYTKIWDGDSWENVMPVGSIFDTVNGAFAYANTFGNTVSNISSKLDSAYFTTNTAFDQANSAYNTAVSAFNEATAKGVIASAAFDAANNAVTDFSPAFNRANGAFTVANAAFAAANSAAELAAITTVTLTDAATINWNLNTAKIAFVTLGGNRTLATPTNLQAGTFILHVIQGTGGSKTLSFSSAFKWPAGVAPTLTTTAGARDILSFVCDGANMYGSYLPDVK